MLLGLAVRAARRAANLIVPSSATAYPAPRPTFPPVVVAASAPAATLAEPPATEPATAGRAAQPPSSTAQPPVDGHGERPTSVTALHTHPAYEPHDRPLPAPTISPEAPDAWLDRHDTMRRLFGAC